MHVLSAPRRFFTGKVQLGLGLLLGVVALYLAARGLDFGQLLLAFAGVQPVYVGLALLSVLATAGVKAIRWRCLFGRRGTPLSTLRLANLIIIGQAVNLLLPARVGELVRAYLTGQNSGTSKAYVLGTVATEKLLDVVALALLVLGLLPFIALPGWLAGRVGPVVMVALILAAIIAGLMLGRARWLRLAAWLLHWLPRSPAMRWQQRIAAGIDGLSALGDPGLALAAWGWTLAAWLLAALTNWLLFLAFGLPPSAAAAFFLLAVLQAGVAVPSVPGKIGVFHYLCVLALAVFGVPGPAALAYGFVLHFLVVGSTAAWAAAALWEHSTRQELASGRWRA